MKTTAIKCQVGIYNTQYTIRDYGNRVVVTIPFIKWTRDTGTLAFAKARVTDSYGMKALRHMATTDSLYFGDTIITDIVTE